MPQANNPIPGTPEELPIIRGTFWTLSYRANKMMNTQNFEFQGTHEEAISKGRAFCEASKIAFLNVSPFFLNIVDSTDRLLRKAKEESAYERKPGVVY